jgi:hypothetical protein
MPLSAVIWANPEFVSGDYLNRTFISECSNTESIGKNGEASPCISLTQARRIIHTALWHFNRFIPYKPAQKLKTAFDSTFILCALDRLLCALSH